MRKYFYCFFVLVFLFSQAACGVSSGAGDGDSGPFLGKIAIVTSTVDQNEEEYRSAEILKAKYGEDKIVHRTWPVNISTEGEQMITVLQNIASDLSIKAVIINPAVINTNAAVDKLLEKRDDMFIAYCSPAENPQDVTVRADLCIHINETEMGEAMVMQAKALGADTFVHYSFPRHMSIPTLSIRRDNIREVCEREGIRFVDLTAPDPTGDAGIPGAQQFIFEDVPKQVAVLGKNTAFFATNCAMQYPLISQVVNEGAIFPIPCCPSPFHGFPAALGIADHICTGEYDADGNEIVRFLSLNEIVEEIRSQLAVRGVAGRLSTWSAPASMMWTTVCTEYAIMVLNGEVTDGVIDIDILSSLCKAYAADIAGDDVDVMLESLSFEGRTYDNYIVALVEYLVY